MKKELKVRIADHKATEGLLTKIGASFIKEATSFYTYFNQPAGKVMKVTENDQGAFKTIIEKNGDQFNIVANEPLKEVRSAIQELTNDFGVKKKIKNIRRFYSYNDFVITTNQIEGVGQFLIIEGENPTTEFVKDKIGIGNPQIVTQSFDNL